MNLKLSFGGIFLDMLSWNNLILALLVMIGIVLILNITKRQEKDKKQSALDAAIKEKITTTEDYFNVVETDESDEVELPESEVSKSEEK